MGLLPSCPASSESCVAAEVAVGRAELVVTWAGAAVPRLLIMLCSRILEVQGELRWAKAEPPFLWLLGKEV